MNTSRPSCSISTCKFNTLINYKLNLFGFPKDPNLRKQWIDKINEDYLDVTENMVLCSFHFQSSCFIRNGDEISLKAGSVPSINLPTRETNANIIKSDETEQIYLRKSVKRKQEEIEHANTALQQIESEDYTNRVYQNISNKQISYIKLQKPYTKVNIVHLNKNTAVEMKGNPENKDYVHKSAVINLEHELDIANERKNGYIMQCFMLTQTIEDLKQKQNQQSQQIKTLQANHQQLKKETNPTKEKVLFMYNKRGFLSMTEFGKKSRHTSILTANKKL